MTESKVCKPVPDWPRLGEEIAARREELGLTKLAAASQAGLSVNGWRRLEEGRPGQVETLLDVAQTLGWHALYPFLLLTGNAEMLIVHPESRIVEQMDQYAKTDPDYDLPALHIYGHRANGLRRFVQEVPLEVIDLLAEDGQLLDYAVLPSPASGVKFAVLAARQGPAAMGDSVRAMSAIDAVKKVAEEGGVRRMITDKDDEIAHLFRNIIDTVEDGALEGENRVRFLAEVVPAVKELTEKIAEDIVQRSSSRAQSSDDESSDPGDS